MQSGWQLLSTSIETRISIEYDRPSAAFSFLRVRKLAKRTFSATEYKTSYWMRLVTYCGASFVLCCAEGPFNLNCIKCCILAFFASLSQRDPAPSFESNEIRRFHVIIIITIIFEEHSNCLTAVLLQYDQKMIMSYYRNWISLILPCKEPIMSYI